MSGNSAATEHWPKLRCGRNGVKRLSGNQFLYALRGKGHPPLAPQVQLLMLAVSRSVGWARALLKEPCALVPAHLREHIWYCYKNLWMREARARREIRPAVFTAQYARTSATNFYHFARGTPYILILGEPPTHNSSSLTSTGRPRQQDSPPFELTTAALRCGSGPLGLINIVHQRLGAVYYCIARARTKFPLARPADRPIALSARPPAHGLRIPHASQSCTNL